MDYSNKPGVSHLDPQDDHKHEIEMVENEKSITFEAQPHGDTDNMGQELTGYEDLTLWQTAKTFKKTCLLCLAVTFSAAAEGYEIGLSNNINANPGFNHSIGTDVVNGEKTLAASQFAIWSPLSATAQILGQVGFPFISSRFGRRWSLNGILLTATIAITMQSVASDWKVWAGSKIFTGLSVGALQTVVPLYVCELAPTKIRGSLISLYNFWFQFGNFFPPIVFQVLQNTNKDRNWKMPIYTQWATVGLIAIIYLMAPESPVWCAQKGRREQGIAILHRLNGSIEGYSAEKQYDILVRSTEYEKKKNDAIRKEHWWNIFLGTNLLRLVISTWTTLGFQLLGLGLFLTYGSIFYKAAGVDDPFLVVIINNCITLGSIIPIIIFADKIGRRGVCLIGMNLMWIACLLVGVLGVVDKGKVVNALLVLFSCIWTLGLQTSATAAYGYLAETSTASLREYTTGWAYGIATIFGQIWGILIPYMISETEWNWNLKTGFFFFGIGAFSAVGGWFVLPETSRRTPGELDELFARKIKPWKFHKTKTATELAVDQQEQDNGVVIA